MKNIIQLYFDVGRQVPFVVRRANWGPQYGLAVTSVSPRRSSGGWYGEASGFGLPPLDGTLPNDYWGFPGQPVSIGTAGSYQWQLVSPVPEHWLQYLATPSPGG